LRRPSTVLTLCCSAGIALAAITVGGGSPTLDIQQSFVASFFRGTFSKLVIAPLTNVVALGSPGLVQTFSWAADKSLTAALVNPDPYNANNTMQMYADLYAFYLSVGGVGANGYPVNDTSACPASSYGVCNYQLFTKNSALFVYVVNSSYPGSGKSYSVSDPFYTEWNNDGGISGLLGAAISAVSAVTSVAGSTGTQQLFTGGAIYYYALAPAATASAYTVSGAIYNAFASSGGPLTSAAGGIGTLGFPVTQETILASGQHKQIFENGTVLWTPGSNPDVQFPVMAIQLDNVNSTLTLPIGGTSTLVATVVDVYNNVVTDRTLSWSTSNGNAVTILSSGNTATLKAVGAGSARIQATVAGTTSTPIYVTVIGQCCAIGAGAPTPALTQAFQAAVARNNLSVLLPNPTPVAQSGGGYIQTLTAADGSGTTWVVAESGTSAVAYVLGGALYKAYLAAGGFSGPLGYPASDASAGGTQSFTSGAALAGSPVRLVPVPIAAKWIASGAETGPLGGPAGDSIVFTSYSGRDGNSQTFTNGTIFGIASGPRSGQAFISTGPILARYLALSGPTGLLGTPISDVFASGAALRENFEAGYIDLQPGAMAAVEHYNPLNPSVTAVPATVAPGGKVHISISGFAFGSSLNVSVTGQSNFTVAAPGGEFGWDIVIPATAKAGTVTIQAKAAAPGSASASYTIAPIAQLRPVLTIVSGDQQTGAPGAALASPLIAVLADSSGNPLPGVPVSYSVSPGASAAVSTVTDANGQISAALRLQAATGIALLSVSAAAQTVTFGAISATKTLTGFPAFTQADDQGALTAALAASIAWFQNTGALAPPNGRATPVSVHQYLTANGGFAKSETGTQIANPWVAMQFAGVAGGISIEPANVAHALDLVNAGSPIVLELSLLIDGAPGGGTAVNAIGINADGTIAIADPNPTFGQTSLSGYLKGFSVQGHTIQASLSGIIRIVPGLTAPAGFVSAAFANSAPSASSPAGACPNLIDIPDQALAGQSAPAGVGAVRFLECDGTQPAYQLAFGTQTGAAILDLSGNPVQTIAAGSALFWQVTHVSGALTISPQQMAITAVVNAAGFGPGLSPGEIISIFGTGFTAGQAVPAITLNGQPVQVLAAFPFQVNAVIPVNIAPGNAILAIKGQLGTITGSVTILPFAPGILVITNQDGTLNSASNPAQRGADISIYGTGLGATTAQGSQQVAITTVNVAIGPGAPVRPSFAGLVDGAAGLYLITVQIPPGAAPGSSIGVTVQEAGRTSNTVAIAVE
jgi:uncharacterized protein (TIGR03437 family)